MKPFLHRSLHRRTFNEVEEESGEDVPHFRMKKSSTQLRAMVGIASMFLLLMLFFSACGEVAPVIKAVQPMPTPLTTLPHVRYTVLIQYNVAYGPLAAEKLDLCLPEKASGLRPGVILVHGGAWVGGDKITFDGPCRLLAQQGFVAATVNYRLGVKSAVQTMWPAQLVDVQLAVRWLRAQANRLALDPQRIGAWGSSAGGHLVTFLGSLKTIYPGDQAQLLANESPSVSWVVDEFGPVDLTENRDPALNGVFLTLFGASYQKNPAAYHNASPIFDVNSQSAPTLIIQGTHDTTVPPMQSIELLQALQRNNVPALFVSYKGEHNFHGFTKSQRLAIMAQEVNFLIELEHP